MTRAEAVLLAMGQMVAEGAKQGEEGPTEVGGLTKLEAALAQSLTLARSIAKKSNGNCHILS